MNGLACIGALKALGEESRLRMLRLLYRRPMSVNEIAEALEIAQPSVSKHLRILHGAGLLEIEKCGRQRRYVVNAKLKSQAAESGKMLDLGCCCFRLDKLPR